MVLSKAKVELAFAVACMNPYDLCEVTKIQYQTYRRVINGNEAKPATVGKIAKALGVDPAELLEEEK